MVADARAVFISSVIFTRALLLVTYCMIGLCHLMAGDDSRMAGGESRMVGGESRMTGDCCRPEGSIHRCIRTHSHLYSHICSDRYANFARSRTGWASLRIFPGSRTGDPACNLAKVRDLIPQKSQGVMQ
jgi:hypothetical protein